SLISPAEGGKLPATIFTRVDLPAPLSPMRPTISPGSRWKSTPASASMAPKCFETALSSSRAIPKPPVQRRPSRLAPPERRYSTPLCDTYLNILFIGTIETAVLQAFRGRAASLAREHELPRLGRLDVWGG